MACFGAAEVLESWRDYSDNPFESRVHGRGDQGCGGVSFGFNRAHAARCGDALIAVQPMIQPMRAVMRGPPLAALRAKVIGTSTSPKGSVAPAAKIMEDVVFWESLL